MAAVWLAMMVFSLGLLLVGSVKLPTASPLVQEGPLGKDTGAHPRAETGVSDPVAPQNWGRSTTGEGGREEPLAAHQKEDVKVVSKNIEEPLKKDAPVPTTAGGISTSGLTQKGNTPELPNAVPFGKAPQETGNANSKEVLHVKSPEHGLPSPAPKSGHVGDKGLPVVATQTPSPAVPLANKTLNVPLAGAGMVSTVTEHWPWLEDQTSATSQELEEGGDVSTAIPRLQPTSSATTEWLWLRVRLAASSQASMVDLLDVSTATLKGGTDAHQPRLKPKGNYGVSHPKVVVTTPKGVWSWLDEASTPSSSWAGNSDVSTETPGQTLVAEKTTLRGRINSRLGPVTVHSRKTATATTSPSTASPRANSSLLSQCLLAISLFGLVAAIFIVITAVLAALLWRQKRAYKRRSQRPTEMVCISSLLATEEADEARKRQPRVKRVKMLADTNGLETEMDNLTLNSFLPEH